MIRPTSSLPGFIGSPRMNFLAADVLSSGNGSATFRLRNHGQPELTPATRRCAAVRSEAVIGIRPEHFVDPAAGDATIDLRLDVAEHLGVTSYLYANTKSGEQIIVQSHGARHEAAADVVRLGLSAERAFAFTADGRRLR